ncbi:MAG: 5'/3'-nucleotidase SurE [Planctomycetota bacterium]
MLTNDDGIDSPGLFHLYNYCKKRYQVYIVAPATEKSGKSHAITLYEPIFYSKVNNNKYIIEGTPTDCVKIALSELFPDVSLVISGINLGFNIGPNVFYSSTVSQCLEAFLYGKNAIALSLQSSSHPQYSTAIKVLDKVLSYVENNSIDNFCISINIPALKYNQLRGIKVANHAVTIMRDDLLKGLSPRKKPYFWVKNDPLFNKKDKKFLTRNEKFPLDINIVTNRYVAITPLKPILFDEEKVSDWYDLKL